MSTEVVQVGEDWVNVNTLLSAGLVNGQDYTFQNIGSGELYIREDSSVPAAEEFGHFLNPADAYIVTPVSGQDVYVRSKDCKITLVVTEAN